MKHLACVALSICLAAFGCVTASIETEESGATVQRAKKPGATDSAVPELSQIMVLTNAASVFALLAARPAPEGFGPAQRDELERYNRWPFLRVALRRDPDEARDREVGDPERGPDPALEREVGDPERSCH